MSITQKGQDKRPSVVLKGLKSKWFGIDQLQINSLIVAVTFSIAAVLISLAVVLLLLLILGKYCAGSEQGWRGNRTLRSSQIEGLCPPVPRWHREIVSTFLLRGKQHCDF
jgi:hypothetical protein